MDSLAGDSAIKLFGQTIAVPFIPLPLSSEVYEDTATNECPLPISWSQTSGLRIQFEDERMSYTSAREERRPTLSCTEASTAQLEYVKSKDPSLTNGSAAVRNGTPCKKEMDGVDFSVLKEKAFRKPDKVVACPRCDSFETKFCYYNNYNVNQPRHFCKNCQRYWTAGGSLRNVPIGAGRRKNKHGMMMLHRHMLHENIAVRQDTQDAAQQRSSCSQASKTLESCVATNLPTEVDFVIQSDTLQGLTSSGFLCDCHPSDDTKELGDAQEVRRCCRVFSRETRFQARSIGGLGSCRKGASRCAPTHSATSSWARPGGGFWTGAAWSSVQCTTPRWACSGGVHHQPTVVQINKYTDSKAVNLPIESCACGKSLYADQSLVDVSETEGAHSVSKPGETKNSTVSARCSPWTATGMGSTCDVGSGEMSELSNKVLDHARELLSHRHVNPAAMIRSMAFQDTL